MPKLTLAILEARGLLHVLIGDLLQPALDVAEAGGPLGGYLVLGQLQVAIADRAETRIWLRRNLVGLTVRRTPLAKRT